MVGVYKIKVKDDRVYKYLQTTSEVGEKLARRLKKKKQLTIFKRLVETLHLDKTIGNYVVKGTCLSNRGDYYSPYISGICLVNMGEIKRLDTGQIISILLNGSLLLKALNAYQQLKGYLIGDWTLHNIIFNVKTGYLVNIDLEGFYTYSPFGLQLSWNNGEANYNSIKKRIRGLQKKLVRLLYTRYRSPNPQHVISCDLLTTVQLPGAYQLVYPDKITSYYPHLAEYLNYLNLTHDPEKTEKYLVMLRLGVDNPYTLIIPTMDQDKYPLINFIPFFSYQYNLPIIYKVNPLRSKLLNT